MHSHQFHRAIAERALQLQLKIVTDVGEFDAPPDIARRYREVKLTARHRPDRRTKKGRALLAWEAEFIAQKLREWAES
jgi:hypothetical protein